MSTSLQECPRCLMEARLRGRNFSDQATAALLVWEELDKSLIGEAICDMCYSELREVLIERASELETGKLITPAERREAYAKVAASAARAKATMAKTSAAVPAPTVEKAAATTPAKATVAAKPASASTAKGATVKSTTAKGAAAKTSPITAKKATAAKKTAAKKAAADAKKKPVKTVKKAG